MISIISTFNLCKIPILTLVHKYFTFSEGSLEYFCESIKQIVNHLM